MSPDSAVSITGTDILIDGTPTVRGRTFDDTRVEGLLPNVRAVQALFDDANPATRDRWAYPDTGRWDPDRNVREFVEALPTWRAHGLRGVTINLQCGSPEGYSDVQPWTVSAFRPDGSLKPAWLDRLDRVLTAAADCGIVVICGYFYFGQDGVLRDEEAVRRGVRNATAWLRESGHRNVIVEVNNECDVRYDHEILRPDRVTELIKLVRRVGDGAFPVGTSFSGGTVPTNAVVDASDLVLLHGNGVDDPAGIAALVDAVRDLPAYEPMPVVINEDDHFGFDDPPSNASVALHRRASWGYFDPGTPNYRDGYQCPPVEWSINTERKRSFFDWVARVTGADPD